MSSDGYKLGKLTPGRNTEQGYILLTLLLFVCLMMIATAAIVPSVAFEIRRAREEELVHRGVQYTRAIRLYSKRTGRYPVRLEELIGGSDFRYIRKIYKDPITGGDFRLLHLGDVQPSTAPKTADSQSDPTAGDSAGNNATPQPVDSSSSPAHPLVGSPVQNSPQASAPQPGAPAGVLDAASQVPPQSGAQPGLLIFGVASKSKAHSIRSFDHKEHYNEWLFFYDPRFDRGYEIKGPTSMTLPTFPAPTQPGQSLPAAGTVQPPPQTPQETPQNAPQ